MKNITMTLDIDAFFAQAEQKRNKALINKPIGIGKIIPNNKGIISTASYEARKFNIKSGMPIYKAKKLCPNLIIIEPDMEYYIKLSSKIFQIVKSKTNNIEIGSIDEASFILDINTIKNIPPIKFAKLLQNEIFRTTNLTTSIGISDNKILSKIASNLKKPNGTSTLYSFEIEKKLWEKRINIIPYLGFKTNIFFNSHNIFYIKDLFSLLKNLEKQNILKQKLGSMLNYYLDVIQGKAIDLHYHHKSKEINNSISLSKTFGFSLNNYEAIEKELFSMLTNLHKKMKYRNLSAKTISLFLKNMNKTFSSKTFTFDKYHNDLKEFWHALRKIFNDSWNQKPLNFLSVDLNNLIDQFNYYEQITLNNILVNKTSEKINEFWIVKKLNKDIGQNLFTTAKDFKIIKKHKDKKKLMQNDKIKFKSWNDGI